MMMMMMMMMMIILFNIYHLFPDSGIVASNVIKH